LSHPSFNVDSVVGAVGKVGGGRFTVEGGGGFGGCVGGLGGDIGRVVGRGLSRREAVANEKSRAILSTMKISKFDDVMFSETVRI